MLDSDATLHLTEWKLYRELDPSVLKPQVKNSTVIDGRNALDRELWIRAGWKFRALGRG
jgi:UDPglucose 6-dehydrogenase